MSQSKPTDPRDYMGVYKSLDDVPDRRRLHQHAAAYNGRDVWDEYLTERLFDSVTSDRFQRHAELVGEAWADHTTTRGRHHALATPTDVETWFASLLDQYTVETVGTRRFRWLEGFFTWLQCHTEHPHVYHPVWMAAADPEASAAGRLWDFKLGRCRSGGDSE